MKKTHKPSAHRNQGYALLITIVFVGIALLLLGSVMNWTNSSARQTERNNLFSLGTGAAEAADENVIAYVTRDFYNQAPKSATNYTGVHFCSQYSQLAGQFYILQQSHVDIPQHVRQ